MFDQLRPLATAVAQAGGQLWLVGGTVRDAQLGLPISDEVDAEIFGLSLERIEHAIRPFGNISQVGKQFAILRLQTNWGVVEIAAPRREKKIGAGHRGFDVQVDPQLPLDQAARRRDFTINAMYLDPLTNQLADPFGGQADVREKTLRLVSPDTFPEDPLRVLRAMQLAARFECRVEPATLAVLQAMIPSVQELPPERLVAEWKKLMYALKPSIGLALGKTIGYFARYAPVIDQLAQTPQDPKYHPEGNVWNHTLLTVDQAAGLVRQYHPNQTDRLVVMLAAWLHDIGKVQTTQQVEGTWIARGHAEAGAALARPFLLSQGFSENVTAQVEALVREHMHLFELERLAAGPGVTDGALRRLVNRLQPAAPMQLLTVREADARGNGLLGKTITNTPSGAETVYTARQWLPVRLNTIGLEQGPLPILRGQDLLDLGWPAGPTVGQVIQAAEAYAEDTNATREMILSEIRSTGSPAEAMKRLLVKPKT